VCGVNTCQAPDDENHNPENVEAEHGFGGKVESLLHKPESATPI
jgi:hypothetical protein